MARFQLWDTPSASLLAETDDLREIAATVQSFIDDAGVEVLGDFTLSDATFSEFPAENHSGQEILLVLKDQLAKESVGELITEVKAV